MEVGATSRAGAPAADAPVDGAHDGSARSPDAPGASGSHQRLLPHRTSVAVLTIGLVLTFGLVLGGAVAANDSADHLLALQGRQIVSALRASVPSIQEPLAAADELASSGGVPAFKQFVESEVGPGAPFSSLSLWKLERGAAPRLLAVEGTRPALLLRPTAESTYFAKVHPSSSLTVTGILPGPVRSYGLAEMPPRTRDGEFVYAEVQLPTGRRIVLPSNSPLSGLEFVLYLGRSEEMRDVMEASVPLDAPGRRGTAVVAYGDSEITVVTILPGQPTGTLSTEMLWLIGTAGVLLSLAAAVLGERLVRRRLVAESLASASQRLFGVQKDIAETLQHALLPSGDLTFPGIEIATRYVPGVRHLEVGGDWYDAIGVDGDHVFVTVGDVSGRGVRAAKTTASLRHAIRAYAVQGDGPGMVLDKLDGLLDVERDECFATVLCALVDVPGHRMTLASAGHPPPLLVDAAGSRFVPLPVNAPVGVQSTANSKMLTLEVAPDSVLVAYTDGLIERRGRSLDEGFDELRAAAGVRTGTLDGLLEVLVRSLLPRGSDDDIAILGIKWTS